MPPAELLSTDTEVAEAIDDDLAGPPASRASGPDGTRCVVYLVLGIGMIAVALLAGPLSGVVRALVGAIGVVLVFRGSNGMGRIRFGSKFQLGTWLAIAWMALVVGSALLEPVLPLAEGSDTSATLNVPRMLPPGFGNGHVLGTNNFGLDLLARVVEGARVSLTVVFVATAIGLLVGGTIGVVAGYRRGPVEGVVGVLTDVVLAFPPLILLLAVATIVEPTRVTLSLALAFLTLPTYIRMARANTISIVQRDFVSAARSMGSSGSRTMFTEVAPNVILPLLSYALVSLSVLIVAEAALSFLGLGIMQPNPTWGNMIAEGMGGVAEEYPHIVLVPGAVLFLVVLSLNLLGERARERWDPSKRSS